MPLKPAATQTRLKDITKSLTMTAETLGMLADNLNIPLLESICTTTQSLLKFIEVTHLNKLVDHSESQSIIPDN
jgi:hypothetical protein